MREIFHMEKTKERKGTEFSNHWKPEASFFPMLGNITLKFPVK